MSNVKAQMPKESLNFKVQVGTLDLLLTFGLCHLSFPNKGAK